MADDVISVKSMDDIWKKLQIDELIEEYNCNPEKFVLKIRKEQILFYQVSKFTFFAIFITILVILFKKEMQNGKN